MGQAGDRSRIKLQANKVAVRSNEALTWCSGAAWQFYRSFLSGPAELFIPEHTRDAFFQLWCDLRSNVPKDRAWIRRHADALQPRTTIGYIALASFVAFLTAGGTSFLCLALAVLAVLGYALVGAVLVAGLTAGFWLLIFSGALLISSFVIAWSASFLAAGYVFLASLSTTLTFLRNVLSQRKSPLQEARQAADTVRNSKVPIAAFGDDEGNSSSMGGAPAVKLPTGSKDSSGGTASSEATDYSEDYSPGRAQANLGMANLQQTHRGIPVADAAAMGGPTLAGRQGAAVHPSILPDEQRYASSQDFVNA